MKTLGSIVLIMLLAVFLVGMSNTTHSQAQRTTTDSTAQSSGKGNGVASQESTVTGPPSITAQLIESVLDAAQSPARGTGQALYDLGVQYNVDPAYALAFFEHESSFGKYGIAYTNLGLGNIRCTDGYTCRYGFRAYRSWPEGYEDWYKLISWYCNTLHKCTVETIIPTYAPSSENNTTGYIQAVLNAVQQWRSEGSK